MKKELTKIVEEAYKGLEEEGAFGFQAPEKLRESGYFVKQMEWRLASVMFDKDFEYTQTALNEALDALFELASEKFHGGEGVHEPRHALIRRYIDVYSDRTSEFIEEA